MPPAPPAPKCEAHEPVGAGVGTVLLLEVGAAADEHATSMVSSAAEPTAATPARIVLRRVVSEIMVAFLIVSD